MRVLTGHSPEAETSLPYLPWVEILETALAGAETPEAFRDALGPAATEVARLVPHLRRVFPDLPPPVDLPPEQERRYLFNSIRDFLGRAGEIQPLLLVLDDLQWADEPSMLLLPHLAPTLGDVPVLILGTYRDEEARPGTTFGTGFTSLARERLVHRIALRPFAPALVDAMLTALADRPAPPALVQLVYSETDGNAFFVEEVFRHLMEEGRLLDEEGRWRTDLEVGETEVPHSVRLVIERRLERISSATRDVLTLAAVIGRFFDGGVLTMASETEEDRLFDALDEAERSRLVRATDDSSERFGFVHELIRQTLLAGLGVRRGRAHLRVADAIEKRFLERADEHASELVFHLSRGGSAAEPRKLRRYLALAGKQALGASAWETALGHLAAARTMSWDDDRSGRADLLEDLGLALRSMQRWDDAVAVWDEAAEAFAKLGDREREGHVRWEAAYQLAWAGRYEESLMMVGQGLATLEGLANPDRGRLLAMSSVMFAMSGYRDAADTMLQEAFEVGDVLDDDGVRGTTLSLDVVERYLYMVNDQVMELAPKAAVVLERTGALWQLAETRGFALICAINVGRWDEAERLLDENEPLAVRLGNRQAELLNRRGRILLSVPREGDLERFERMAQSDLEFCRAADMPYIAESHVFLSRAHFMLGRWEAAVDEAREAVRTEEEGTVLVGWHRGQLLRMLAYVGERDQALAMLDDPGLELPVVGQPAGRGPWFFLVSALEALWEVGEMERLAGLYPLALEAMGNGNVVTDYMLELTDRFAGMAAAAGGAWSKAEGHFDRAIELAGSLGHSVEIAEIRRARGRMHLMRGGPGDDALGRELLESAATDYHAIGMPRHVELCRKLQSGSVEA
jgi:tetratricopeptide (TPR) repeat protein